MGESLEKGWRKRRLIRDLAGGEKKQIELAVVYGVQQPAISQFAKRHADEIEAVRGKLDDEWASLWVADRYNRIAEMQSDIESVDDALSAGGDAEKLLRVKHAAFRQIAEELGQLKTTVDVNGRMTYVVEGVDLGKLR
jgi:hypothetical protein